MKMVDPLPTEIKCRNDKKPPLYIVWKYPVSYKITSMSRIMYWTSLSLLQLDFPKNIFIYRKPTVDSGTTCWISLILPRSLHKPELFNYKNY